MTVTSRRKGFVCFARGFVVLFLLNYSMTFEGMFFEGFRPNIKLGLRMIEIE